MTQRRTASQPPRSRWREDGGEPVLEREAVAREEGGAAAGGRGALSGRSGTKALCVRCDSQQLNERGKARAGQKKRERSAGQRARQGRMGSIDMVVLGVSWKWECTEVLTWRLAEHFPFLDLKVPTEEKQAWSRPWLPEMLHSKERRQVHLRLRYIARISFYSSRSFSGAANTTALATRSTSTSDVSIHVHERRFFDFIVKVLKVLKKFYPPAILTDRIKFNGYVPGKHVSFNTQQTKAFDGDFRSKGNSYLLYSKKFGDAAKKPTGNVNLYLVANLVGTFGSGFNEANLKVDVNVTATLVLGIKGNYVYKDSKNLTTIEGPIPYASLNIEKILEIGAFIVLDLGVDYELNLKGAFAAGFGCTWTNVGASLDLIHTDKSGILGNWELLRNCKRVLEANVEVKAAIDPFVALAIRLKIKPLSALTDKLTGQVSLVERVSLRFPGLQ
ncbi:hypothetical protein B0H17DRAFT_1187514 [Mycena rosella]|uniref:Uncharacterized protein n=1 Tax=Mycena rosella TaxID=1033263 RepID=A0AAD7BYH7_MYCRO|nr:hypothetical protein B0H17DRAFT_1187514 [Mycena rosella]